MVVLGSAGVGQTSIINQFMHKTFTEKRKRTIKELHRHMIEFERMSVEIDILDTSGYYEFPGMRRLAISTGDAFILVYSVDNDGSFEYVASLRDEIKEEKQSEDYSIVVVANKNDLDRKLYGDHIVDELMVCIDWKVKFVTTSAKTGENIDVVFHTLEKKIKERLILEEKRLSLWRRISLRDMIVLKDVHYTASLNHNGRKYSVD